MSIPFARDMKTALSNANPLVGYAMSWQSYVLNPMLISVGLISRRKLATVAGIAGQIFIIRSRVSVARFFRHYC